MPELTEKKYVTAAAMRIRQIWHSNSEDIQLHQGDPKQIQGDDIDLNDLTYAIGLAYSTASGYDDTPRKRLVFTPQNSSQ